MRLAKATAKLMAALTISLCLIPGTWAQGKAIKRAKMARKAATKQAAAEPAAAPAAATPAAAPGESPDSGTVAMVGKRDPFVPLVTDKKDSGAEHLPPGKAGIVIASVRVDGTVKSGNGMIAVVSNPDQRVYFIREGDQLYDGDVEKISLDGVTFKENSKDAFGKPVERIVTKRIYASAGEQQ
ncbi:MAG: pilus assembly protein PilP [Candidatus Acidiferrales bacterium]